MAFVQSIERATQRGARINFKAMAKGDVPTTYANISKAARLLGYRPTVSLSEGIRLFVSWFVDYYGNLAGGAHNAV